MEVSFETPTPEDPDPLETIEPLTGVTLTVLPDGEFGFTFEEVRHGDPTVRLQGLPEGTSVLCVTYVEDGSTTTQCLAQSGAEFPVINYATPERFPPNTAWVPNVEVTGDTISIEVDGTVYTGNALVVEDGPTFVQIDPNTGGLAEPVTRRSGIITAAELAAALG